MASAQADGSRYKVWIDRFKLLAGEPWPSDIDRAIKTRTFRMIALLSQHSRAKENSAMRSPISRRNMVSARAIDSFSSNTAVCSS